MKQRTTPLATFVKLFRPLEAFVRAESLGGTLLMCAAVVALIWANSGASESYVRLWEIPFTIGFGASALSKPLILWINDLLMAIFFLLVGLEIKRELLVGELDSLSKAALPVIAAIGGMLVPAGIYALVAGGGETASGWGIPMATDIAFALGVMRLLGSRVPSGLLVFLMALAIIDDLGAILVIALFYSGDVALGALGGAAAATIVLVLMNRLGVRAIALYLLVGLPLWFAILESGIHATIAGVILGFCVPATSRWDLAGILADARRLIGFAENPKSSKEDVGAALRALEHRADDAESPLSNLEHALLPWVNFAIIPIFALANAGVDLRGVDVSYLAQPVSLGVTLGLVLGKPIGVVGASLLAVKLGLSRLPTGVRLPQLLGAGILAGIGFTMALFIAGLAFEPGSSHHAQAKVGILAASILAGCVGLVVLYLAGSGKPGSGERRAA